MTAAARVAGWLIALTALACVCLWSAADRLARQGVLLRLPDSFLSGGNALTARAAEALRRADPLTADQLARRATRRRPVDASALRVAGLAAIAAGDPRRGDALMRLAGAAGWRDAPTQLYWAQAALATGAPDVAAERLDAVARAGVARAPAKALLLRLESTPRGRAALLQRWRIPDSWQAAYLADVEGLGAAAMVARVMLVADARRTGVRLDPAAVDLLGWGLVGNGRADLASRLVARPAGRWVADFRTDAPNRPGPFDWQFEAASGLDIAILTRGSRPTLHVVASGPALLPVASQLTRLPIGDARFTAAVEGAKTPSPLLVAFDCVSGAGAAATPEPFPARRTVVRLRVPVGCPTQRLTLSVTGEEAGRGADLWISAPTIAAVVP